MGESIIKVDRLTKRYGTVTALAEVSAQVQPGEFLALLGPSGCGKTTLLRLIAGFIDPSEGEIVIEGVSMNRVPPDQRPVNTVFQNYALFPHLTVRDNLAFGPRRKRVAREEIDKLVAEALEMVGMEAFSKRYPSELSGGQQQRIALSRAIINKPKVLLLDEPLGALDLKLRKRMQIELKRLHEQLRMTFIYVTHDQEEALVMADRIAVMGEGRIVQLGTGQEIYREPNSRYVADFIGDANLLDCEIDHKGWLRLGDATGERLFRPAEAGDQRRVTLMVRPEHVKLGEPKAESEAVLLKGRLRDLIFVGSGTKFVVALDSGHEIVAESSSNALSEQLEQGAEITLHWRAEHARVLNK